MCACFAFSSAMVGLLIVVKSTILLPVTSSFSLAFPSTELIAISKMGIDCFFVPFTVTMWRDSCLTGFRPSLLITSLETKFLPDPVSRYAQNVSPFIFTGMMAGNDLSSLVGVYPFSIGIALCSPSGFSQRLV